MSISFSPNERVLCYHGPLIYEAKVLKLENWDETTTKLGSVGPHYFVHYKGWKQTWDEWVPASRLLKFNETNIATQKSLQTHAMAHSASASSSKHGSKSHAGTSGNKDGSSSRNARKDGGRGTKRGRDDDDNSKRPEMKLAVPEALKVLLVDDWEAVTKNNQLVSLPRNPTVSQILEDFKKYLLTDPSAPSLKDRELLIPTIIAGLQVYFDRSLGANLLYRFERPQYAEIRKEYITGPNVVVGQEKEMSHVYGAEHLLRMIVNLPQMIASSTMDPDSVGLVRDYVNELLIYLLKERGRLFLPEYQSASLQYQNISRS